MPQYEVKGWITKTVTWVIEAKSEEDAINIVNATGMTPIQDFLEEITDWDAESAREDI